MSDAFSTPRIWCAYLLAGAIALCLTGCSGSSMPGAPVAAVSTTKNPLVAEYDVTEFGPGSAWVEFGTDTNYGKKTSTVMSVSSSSPRSNTIKVLVAGMLPSTTYHMRMHGDFFGQSSWVDQDQTFTTGPLPSGNRLSLTVTRPNANLDVKQNGVELLDIVALKSNNLEAAVADLDGNIIWYYDMGSTSVFPFPIKPLPNGNMLINVTGTVQSNGTTAGVYDVREVDLAGNIVRDLPVGELNNKLEAAGFAPLLFGAPHHDILVMPNGHWIMIANTVQNFTDLPGYPGTTAVVGDVLIDLDPNWNPVWVWSSFDHLDVNRHLFGLPDWTHSNALIYSSEDGNLILSMRNQSWIIKIDYANGTGTGDILWKLGDAGDFSISDDDPSQWFYGQHYPIIVSSSGSQTTLAVFDDGNNRVLNNQGTECSFLLSPCYSRAVEYSLDESTRTATVVWQDLPGLFTGWGGSIVNLPNGDVDFDVTDPFATEHNSRVLEVTHASTPQTVWQLDIAGGAAYRAYRVPSLYPGVQW